jgi:type VI secretion system protein ImpH
MATEGGRTSAALSEQLLTQGARFEFFQAVRLLLHLARRGLTPPSLAPAAGGGQPVGYDFAPAQETVRFRVVASNSFPAGEVVRIVAHSPDDVRRTDRPGTHPLEMFVSFLGLTGPNGVLPQHYTTLLIDRLREKDRSLADFLDLFNHRTISLFYRAWEKYRFPAAFERFQLAPQHNEEEDLFTYCLYSLVGLGTPGMRRRQRLDDETVLYYAGHFAHRPRNALSLEILVADYFGLPVRLLQFQGQWLQLGADDQSMLPGGRWPRGRNNRMGVNVIAGERVWDVQSKFRLRLGPLSYHEFCRFTPTGDRLRPACEIARTYAGPHLDFDVQPVLLASEIPWCRLGGDDPVPARLGWNTWVRSGPMGRDGDDVVFRLEEI